MKCYILIIISIVYGISPSFAQDKATEIDKLMQAYYDLGKFNGTILVAENGKVIYEKGFGLANMEWNIPNTSDTKFRIGSITKQFTAMLIMQLVEQEKVKLDGKISDYLPDYRKDIGNQVTIHQLLTHTSGIPSYHRLPDFFSEIVRDPYSVDDFVKKYCSGDLEFEPGSQYFYNNSGYYLLGAIIEKVTGKTYEEVLKEKIFEPLGMKNSGYDHYETVLSNRASGYEKTLSGYKNAVYDDRSVTYSVGAIYSTVEDLYSWDRALYTERLLSKEYLDIMLTPSVNGYAYGWYNIKRDPLVDSKDSLRNVGHQGSIFEFTSRISRWTDDEHLVVLLSNTDNIIEHKGIDAAVINILYGKPYDMPKKDIKEMLYEEISENDVESAKEKYNELKDMYPDEYDFSNNELLNFGYMLQEENMLDEAIDIYKWIVDIDPNWFEGYYGVADVYRKKGEKELAIKYYAKSLELNPEAWFAISIAEILKELTDTED